MKIWKLNFEMDEFDNLIPVKEFTVDEIQSFDGRSHLDDWNSVEVKRMEPEKKLDLPCHDIQMQNGGIYTSPQL